MHHGFVANFCRLLLRGRFPTLSKIYKLVGLPIFSIVWTRTDHNFHEWSRTARHQHRRALDKQSIDDFVVSRSVTCLDRDVETIDWIFFSWAIMISRFVAIIFSDGYGFLIGVFVFVDKREMSNSLACQTHVERIVFCHILVLFWENWNSVHIQLL